MKTKLVALLAVFGVLAIVPAFLSSYYVGLMVLMLIYGILAMSLNLLLGFGGLPSLGHTAFFGVAAYTAGYLALKGLDNFWLDAGAALALSVAIAAVFGFLVLRSRGVYFMLITLALSQVLWGIVVRWKSVTRGHDGLSGIPRPDLVFIPLDLDHASVFYYFTLVFFVLAALAMFQVVRSPFGLVLQGIRDSETRMRALGYNIFLYQYVAFVVAGFFAAVAGVLSVYYYGLVTPGDLHVAMSAKVLLMVILGGAGTFIGPVIGAFSVVLLENLVSGYTERWFLVLGLVYILVIVFAPQGIYGPIKRRAQRWLTRQVR